MDIVCSTDCCYVMQTGIMLTSLFENNREADIRVHVLHNGIDSNSITLIERIASDYGQKITFCHVDETLCSAFPIGRDGQNTHVGTSYATYYRLFLSELLPKDISRVIYLDGDIIVMDSLNDLWATDMHDKAIAAVPDSYNNKIEHYNRLHYPQPLGYFNAGVLLINLDYWRTNNVVSAFCQYASANPDSLYCHDQDILNYVFRESKITLPLRYNMLNEYWF
ncbi:glycosyltransferase family 8 protein, partial [Prevotella sp.]